MAPLRSFTSLRRYVGSSDDWRQAVWNRWLVSYLTPRSEESADGPEANGAEGSSGSDGPRGSAPEDAAREESVEPELPTQEGGTPFEGTPFEGTPSPVGETASMVHRQTAARARLDALSEQLYAVEETLDALRQRLHGRDVAERRSTQRMMELVERMVETVERQSEVLERSIATLERVERRLARVDRWVRPAGIESIPPPSASGIVGLGAGAAVSPSDDGLCAPSMSGSLGDMSVATLLSMFELERRTGWLVIEGQQDQVRFELMEGSVVSASFNDRVGDPVDVLRLALSWRAGSFSFRHVTVLPGNAAARGVGELLLEASRQNDEAVRVLDDATPASALPR